MAKNVKEWYIDTIFGKVAMISWGESTYPPMLLLHGFMDSAATFIPLLELLPDEYYYVSFDLPGHGKSDPLPVGPPPSHATMVEVVRAVVDHMEWSSFVLLAHSMGSIIGFHSNQTMDPLELECITIKIGNYSFTPKRRVQLTKESIKIIAPSMHNENEEIPIEIHTKNVARILSFLGNETFPMLFFYTMPKVGEEVRKTLGMTEGSEFYYDPMTRVENQKRITLMPNIMTERQINIYKELFTKITDELNYREAIDLFSRTCNKKTDIKEESNLEGSNQELNNTSVSEVLKQELQSEDEEVNDAENSNELEAITPNDKSLVPDVQGNDEAGVDNEDISPECKRSRNDDTTANTTQLDVAVTTEPYDNLTPEQAITLRKLLENKLKNDLLNPTSSVQTAHVRFRGQPHLCDGVLKIWCEDNDTLTWLRDAVDRISNTIAGKVIVVKPQAEIQRPLCSVFIATDDNSNIESLMKLLAVQNSLVNINAWSLVGVDRKQNVETPGVLLYLLVPRKDIDVLQMQDRRLYWLMGNVFLEVVQGKSLGYTAGGTGDYNVSVITCEMCVEANKYLLNVTSVDNEGTKCVIKVEQ